MHNVLESIKQTWGRLSRPMQIGVGVFVLGVFLSLVLIAVLSRTQYQVLFSGLSSDDAGAVVAALQERGVSYQLADGGGTILVPEEDVFETRIALATSGMPTGGVVGFEIFNTTRLGETKQIVSCVTSGHSKASSPAPSARLTKWPMPAYILCCPGGLCL